MKTKEEFDFLYRSAREEAMRQMEDGMIQGIVFTENRSGRIEALGRQCIHPEEKMMSADSRFDMASVGKVFTAGCCALLTAQKELDPDRPFVFYLPEYCDHDSNITVRDLAMHVSGFDNSKPYLSPDPDVFRRELFNKRPVRPRLQAFEYACSNFILMGMIAEKITGMDLESIARKFIWEPLGMRHTQWNSPGPGPFEVEHWHPHRVPGNHNDSVCFHCGFPIGCGSCFSTAGDMLLFLKDILERGHFPSVYYDLFLTCGFEKNGTRRSFGWDMSAAASMERVTGSDHVFMPGSVRPRNLSEQTIYHTGWTGQTIFADPGNNFAAVVLSSRTGDHDEAVRGRARIVEKLFAR